MAASEERFDHDSPRPRLDAVSDSGETRVQRIAFLLMRLSIVGGAALLVRRLGLAGAVRSGAGLWLAAHRAACLFGAVALVALATVVFWKYVVLGGSPDGFQRWRVRMPRTIRVLTVAMVLYFAAETLAFVPRYGLLAFPLFGFLFYAALCLLAFV